VAPGVGHRFRHRPGSRAPSPQQTHQLLLSAYGPPRNRPRRGRACRTGSPLVPKEYASVRNPPHWRAGRFPTPSQPSTAGTVRSASGMRYWLIVTGALVVDARCLLGVVLMR
jgi:hypothetical protein